MTSKVLRGKFNRIDCGGQEQVSEQSWEETAAEPRTSETSYQESFRSEWCIWTVTYTKHEDKPGLIVATLQIWLGSYEVLPNESYHNKTAWQDHAKLCLHNVSQMMTLPSITLLLQPDLGSGLHYTRTVCS